VERLPEARFLDCLPEWKPEFVGKGLKKQLIARVSGTYMSLAGHHAKYRMLLINPCYSEIIMLQPQRR
jgi:hypothetical protein